MFLVDAAVVAWLAGRGGAEDGVGGLFEHSIGAYGWLMGIYGTFGDCAGGESEIRLNV